MTRRFEILDAYRITKSGKKSTGKDIEVSKNVIKSATPIGAALKGFTFICKNNTGIKDKCKYSMIIRDVSKGKDTKGFTYSYIVERKHQPRTVEIDGKKVSFKYRNVVKSISLPIISK